MRKLGKEEGLELFLVCNHEKIFNSSLLRSYFDLTPYYFKKYLKSIRERRTIYEWKYLFSYYSAGINIKLELMKFRKRLEKIESSLCGIKSGEKCVREGDGFQSVWKYNPIGVINRGHSYLPRWESPSFIEWNYGIRKRQTSLVDFMSSLKKQRIQKHLVFLNKGKREV